MDDQNDLVRVTWTTRINVGPISRDMIRTIAREKRISLATTIGLAIESYVTTRSTA